MDDVGPWSGVVGPLVALAGILAATLTDPSFSWTHSALSDLGVAGPPTEWLFNGGLALGGLLAAPFVRWRWSTTTGLGREGTAVLGLSLAAMVGVAAFPSGHPLHFPVAVGFYLLFTFALLLTGAGDLRRGAARRGTATVALAVGHLSTWVLWSAGFRPGPGLAVPETVGALVLTGWMVATGRRGLSGTPR